MGNSNSSAGLLELYLSPESKDASEVSVARKKLSLIPPCSGNLDHIQSIDASMNNIVDIRGIVSILRELPRFTSKIPSQAPALRKLKELNLHRNELHTLPEGFSSLESLLKLDLSVNRINFLPRGFMNLKQLQTLLLWWNDFYSVPKVISRMETISELDISHNRISRIDLHELPLNLKSFKANDNLLTIVSPCICKLEGLEHLELSRNSIESIPEFFLSKSSITYLDLHRNKLVRLSPVIDEMRKLKYLDVSYNCLEEFSQRMIYFNDLRELFLKHNNLSQFPDCIGEMPSLEHLDVSYNNAIDLPTLFKKLTSLRKLDISSNKLQKTLPARLAEGGLMEEFVANGNMLTEFPKCVFSWPSIKLIEIRDNFITSIPAEIKKVSSLNVLDISFNALRTLPPEVFEMKRLISLNVVHNTIDHLPKISPQSSMAILHISYNKLRSIPQSLSKLSSLLEFSYVGNGIRSSEVHPRLRALARTSPETAREMARKSQQSRRRSMADVLIGREVGESGRSFLLTSHPGSGFVHTGVDIGFCSISGRRAGNEDAFNVEFHGELVPSRISGKIELNPRRVFTGNTDIDSQFAGTEPIHSYANEDPKHPPTVFCGLFDGHGSKVASRYCCQSWVNLITQKTRKGIRIEPDMLSMAFKELNKKLQSRNLDGGSCAIAVVWVRDEKKWPDKDYYQRNWIENGLSEGDLDLSNMEDNTLAVTRGRLFIVNIGDSRAIIGRIGDAIRLSIDHKPMDEIERIRIKEAGGIVSRGRLNGTLAVSRTLGDFRLKPVISEEVHVTVHDVSSKDEFLLLASDGLWDVMDDQVCYDMLDSGNSSEYNAGKLVNAAYLRGSTDNITCIVLNMNK